MPTLRSLVDDLYATLNINSDDTNIDRRSIKWYIKNKRATLIYNQLIKGIVHSSNYKQSIPCLELELVDVLLSDCCIGLSDGCQVLRSVEKIPTRLYIRGKDDLVVKPLNVFNYKFNHLSDHTKWIVSGNGKFNSRDIFTVVIDDYLYVKSTDKNIAKLLGKYVYVEGIFDDPESLRDFTTCDTNRPCFSEDEEYPIEDWMIDVIKQEIIKSDLRYALSIPEDKSNDATNEVTMQNGGRAS